MHFRRFVMAVSNCNEYRKWGAPRPLTFAIRSHLLSLLYVIQCLLGQSRANYNKLTIARHCAVLQNSNSAVLHALYPGLLASLPYVSLEPTITHRRFLDATWTHRWTGSRSF